LELGAGLGMGQALANTLRETLAQPARLEQSGTVECPHCHARIPAGSQFCPNCGQSLQPASVVCPKCGTSNPAGAKFCSNCGEKLG
jgi:membrane protease subunit (stomatin/prohibitin family)